MKLETIFAAHLRTLALTLRPSTVSSYRGVVRRFLSYLRAAFPHLSQLSQLRPAATFAVSPGPTAFPWPAGRASRLRATRDGLAGSVGEDSAAGIERGFQVCISKRASH